MGKQGASGGGRAARALRLALLVVFALAAVEYIYSYVLETSPLKSYIYPPYNYNNTERDEIRPSTKDEPSIVQKAESSNTNLQKLPTSNSPLLAQNNSLSQNSSTISHDQSVIPVSEYTPIPDLHEKESTTLLTKLLKSSTSVPTIVGDVKSIEFNTSDLPECDLPDDLGPVTVNKSAILSLKDIDQKYPRVLEGGIHSPNNCSTQDKVAIIVPFRDRQQHLALFLNHIHPFLMKQPIEYGIYVIEQYGENKSWFNRAKLFNVGFAEAQRLTKNHWKCFVFHDVDLLPLDTRNLYTCPKQPRHMSVAIDIMDFSLPYQQIFGGVSVLTAEQFKRVNGFSNRYWGWGAEDDDMYMRIAAKGYHKAYYKSSIARYEMLKHIKAVGNPKRYEILLKARANMNKDGLSDLHYKVVKVERNHLFTHVLADINEKR